MCMRDSWLREKLRSGDENEWGGLLGEFCGCWRNVSVPKRDDTN
jgi:hypothetical protein